MKRKLLYPLVITLVVGVFFWQFILKGLLPIPSDTIVGLYHPYRDYYSAEYPNGIPYRNFLITDPVRQQYPWRFIAINQIKQGEWPLWNPDSFSGTPLAANLQSAPFYPLNILFFMVPFPIAWSLLIMLQPLLGGFFLYLYLREMKLSDRAALLGGIVLAFCGFNTVWLTWNTLSHVGLWLPLILYLKEKLLKLFARQSYSVKRVFAFSLLLIIAESSYLLAGHAQIALYVFMVSNVYLVIRFFQLYGSQTSKFKNVFLRRTVVLFTLAPVAIAGIVSVQIIPFFKFVLVSDRTFNAERVSQDGWFIPFQHLIQFIAPDFFGNPASLNYWGTWNYGEMVGYIGIIPLLFSLIAIVWRRDKKTLFFSALLFLSLLFATNNGIAKIPYLLQIPFLSTSQPTRLLFLVDFSLAILSALGFDFFLRKKISVKQLLVVLVPIGGIVLLLWLYVMFGSGKDLLVAKRNLILPSGLFILGVLGSFGFSGYFGKSRPVKQIALFGLIAFTVFDLLRFGWKFTPFTPQEYLFPQTAAIQFLVSQQGKFRIMTIDDEVLPPNFSSIYGIESVSGYDPLYRRDYDELVSAWSRNTPNNEVIDFNRIITPDNFENRITDLLNVRYVLSLSEISSEKLRLVFEEGQTKIYENTEVLPRAYLVESARTVADEKNALEKLFDETISLDKTAIVESDTISL
ncbi:MAG: YfhO family protein, partial [Candidatus Roizmanbacteria bacterium]|nr:YfhO family protein [Candidatus Roizmanbacteria bacterium]